MRHGRNGAAFERQVAEHLRGRGWWCVRAAGSHGAADVVALREGWDPVLVQCKASGAISPAEWDELWDAARRAGGNAVVADRVTDESDRRRTRIRFRVLLGPRTPGDARRRPWEEWSA